VRRRYGVIVTPEAESGIVSAFEYIFERSPLNAERWLRALYKKIGEPTGDDSGEE
jgi:plasmid stabilization system protein ParE